MRRDELIAAVSTVVEILETTGFLDLVRGRSEGKSDRTPRQALEVFRYFVAMSDQIGPNERELLEIFGLEPLEQTDFWQVLIADGPDAPPIRSVAVSAARTSNFLPR